MSNPTFQAYGREFPVNLPQATIKEIAEEISYAKRMELREVEEHLFFKQAQAATETKPQENNCNGRCYRFYC